MMFTFEKEEKSHFEIMEELGQISIFDIEPEPLSQNQPAAPNINDKTTKETAEPTKYPESNIREGDRVTVNIPSGSEDYEYFKYYYPHALTVRGEVLKVDKHLCHVRFKTDVLLLKQHELTLMQGAMPC